MPTLTKTQVANGVYWVEGGRIYEIPDPYDGYDLVVDGPTGIEYVVAVASHFPLNLRAIEEIEAGMDLLQAAISTRVSCSDSKPGSCDESTELGCRTKSPLL